jgi:hypothetical protein
VSASFLLNVFSSVHSGQWTFCFLALWIVSSCRVRSYGREKMVLHGLPVDGLILSHCVKSAYAPDFILNTDGFEIGRGIGIGLGSAAFAARTLCGPA